MNILESLIFNHAKTENKSKIAIIDDIDSCTYSELSIYVSSFEHSLKIEKKELIGEVVACIFDDSIESVICFFGLAKMGAIPCYLNPGMPIESYIFYLNSLKVKYVLVGEQYREKFSTFLMNQQIDYKIIKKSFYNEMEKIEVDDEACLTETTPFFCGYTSGTTGHPSAVLHSHGDVAVMNEVYAKAFLGVTGDDIIFTTSKMYFAYGLNSLFIALYNGATAIVSDRKDIEKNVFEIFEKYKPTIYFSVPRIYTLLLSSYKHRAEQYIPKTCVSAGETLSQKIYYKWKEKYAVEIIDGIGTTETLSTFISNKHGDCKAGSTGKLIKGFHAEIRDMNGRKVEDGKSGVLWVKVHACSTHYLNNTESSENRFIDGWFITNDLFIKDKDGYYYNQGRLNDLIYKNGIWVNPKRIEDKILKKIEFIDVVVIKYSTIKHGLMIVALVENNSNIDINTVAINLKIASEESAYHTEEYIDSIFFVENLPKTYNGKKRRSGIFESEGYSCFIKALEHNGSGMIYDIKSGVISDVNA